MARVNLVPDSEGRPAPGGGADGELIDTRQQYNREDREKAEKDRLKELTRPTVERGSGLPYRGKKTQFEDAVERVQGMIRGGRMTYAQVKAENEADAQSLMGWKTVSPRRGTPGHARMEMLSQRMAVRAAALDRETAFSIPQAETAPTSMREIGWTDAARKASIIARRLGAVGRRASRLARRRTDRIDLWPSMKKDPRRFHQFDASGRRQRGIFGAPLTAR